MPVIGGGSTYRHQHLALTLQNKVTVSYWSHSNRCKLVYDQDTPASATQPHRDIVHLRGFGGLLVFLFLVEEENNVGDVGNVAQSEKSPENSQ